MLAFAPDNTMSSPLQYYEKISNACSGWMVILMFLFHSSSYSQTASFHFEKRNNCAPARVVFYNESSQGTGISYVWNFGNGTVSHSAEKVLEEVYASPGTYLVELEVIQANDTVRTSSQLAIYKGPSARFIVDRTEGCIPLDISFTNVSESGDTAISSFFWDFRDGTTGSSENPAHLYNQAGDFDVLMKITDANGCTDYIEQKGLITVHPEPVIAFTASDTLACEPPLYVNFYNQTKADVDLDFHWDLGNGTASDSYVASTRYENTGIYSVTLSGSNEMGCAGSLTRESYIQVGMAEAGIYAQQGDSVITRENTILCPGITRFAATKASTDYAWTIVYNHQQFTRQGPEFSYLLADSGTIALKLVTGKKSDCPDSAEISFRIDYIRAEIGMDPAYACQLPAYLNLVDLSEGSTQRIWILPDDSERTDRSILYTVTHELTHKEIYSHNVNRLNFPIKLVAISANGCTDTATTFLQVSLPVARFAPDKVSGCTPLEVTFADSSRSDEPITHRTYIINGQPYDVSDQASFTHTFSEPGENKVLLVLMNTSGCSDTSYPVTILAGDKLEPVFTVTPELVCPGGSLQIEDITDEQGHVDFRHFSSPGLFSITTTNPSAMVEVMPLTEGYKPVMLEIRYNGCISDTVIQHAFNVSPPAGDFHEYFSCDSPYVYTFVSDVPAATSIEWSINDSIVSDLDSMQYRFESSGDYQVTLKAFSSYSYCTVNIHKIIPVRNIRADFIVDPMTCLGDSVLFNAQPSDDYVNECYNEGFLWDFKDGTILRRTFHTQLYHIFTHTGHFPVELVARADNGCEDTIQNDVYVIRPDATFEADVDSGCASGVTVTFTKTGTDTIPEMWEWVFGDGTFYYSSASPVMHTYTSHASRTYYASLSVQDIYGCKSGFVVPVHLFNPNAFFEADDNFVCINEPVQFNAKYDSIDNYIWDFGDGTTSSSARSHAYALPGIYNVTLVASKNECRDTITRFQYINVEKADASYTVSDSVSDCYPVTITFTHTGNCNVAEGTWTFDKGIRSSVFHETYQYTYSKPGEYNTSLWIRTPNGCQASHSETISVTGPYATFDFSPDSICYGDPVSFRILSSQDVNEIKWIFGDGETSTETAPVHYYHARGIVYPALWVKNNSCEVTLMFNPLNISAVKATFTFQDNRSVFCRNEMLQVNNQSVGYQDIIWIINDTMIVEGPDLNPFLLSSAGTMQIKQIVADTRGCSDTLVKSIRIVFPPGFVISGDSVICRGNSSTLQINPVNEGWNVLWQPPDGLNDPFSFTPLVTVDSTRSFTATVTDTNGCVSSQNFLVRVQQPPVISRYPLQDTSIFIGESIELIAGSDNPSATYAWTPDYNISCTNCRQPVVHPEHDVIYTVTIKDQCFTVNEQFPIEVIIDFYIEAPDAFSPNGDNHNDIFRLETKNIQEIKEFNIYNRWGNLVFQTNRTDEGWDGTTNGKPQNIDTYAYYVRAVTNHGYETEKKGTFLLLK
jgi:gliding motility-associated-like protein